MPDVPLRCLPAAPVRFSLARPMCRRVPIPAGVVTALGILFMAISAVRAGHAQCVMEPVGGDASRTTCGGISGNGQVLVGLQLIGSSVRPYKWTASNGLQYLPTPFALNAAALAVNGDGTVVAGWARPNGSFQADPVIWGPNGVQTIGPPNGNARVLNPSGSSAAGNVQAPGGTIYDYRPFMWSQSEGIVIADRFPGHPGPDSSYEKGSATAISDSGTIVAGYARGDGEYRVFRWTRGGSMEDLASCHMSSGVPTLDPMISANGGVVVGMRSDEQYAALLFRWSAGNLQDLGSLGGGSSYAKAMNAAGSVIVGSSRLADGRSHAFRWTAASGMVDLGELEDGGSSAAFGVNADGSVVFGLATSGSGLVRVFRWTASTGMQDAGVAGGPSFNANAKIYSGANGQVLATSMFDQLLWRWAYSGSVPDCNFPRIDSITPDTGPTAGGTLFTIAGTNLSGASVTVGSAPATSVVVNAAGTSLTARTPPGPLGPATVSVSASGGTASRNGGFTYLGMPAISSVAPSSGPSVGGTTILVQGEHLAGASVKIRNVAATDVVVDPTGASLTARTPAGSPGPASVSVTTVAGTATLPSGYTYVAAPAITTIAPAFGPALGGTPFTLTGANLSGCAVRIGGTAATGVSVNSAGTSVSAISPPGSVGLVSVEVSTVGGTAVRSNGFNYTVAPTVTSVSPSSGPPAGGTLITVTGTDLQGATVKVGTVLATNVAVNQTGTSLTARTPAGTSGPQAVMVTTLGGIASQAGAFTYLGVPTNVQAGDGTSDVHVAVSWAPASGATGYRVLRAIGGGAATEVGGVQGGSTVSFLDVHSGSSASPQYGQAYNYTVLATFAVGPGPSGVANAGHLRLRAPTGVLASDGTSVGHVAVTWAASPGASGYRVLRAEGTSSPVQVGTTTGALAFTDPTAVPGRLYSYTVRATGNPAGNVSDPSVADTGYRGLSAPTNVLASDGSSVSHVTVTWTAAAGAVSYKVFRDGSETPLQSGIIGTAFNDSSAVPGTGYSYSVRSVAAAGDSPSSASNVGYRQMTAPSNVQASDGTLAIGISITWNPAPGAVGYQVFRSGTTAPVGTTTGPDFTDLGSGTGHPIAGAAYTYSVKAVGSVSGAVSAASGGNSGYRSLGAPAGVAASDGTSPAHVTISWTGVTGATGYRIRRGPAGSATMTDLGNVGSAATSFNDTTAVPGTWSLYSVVATTAAGPSMAGAGDTGHRALSVPANVQATDGTSSSHVRVSWTASAGAARYEVFRRIGAGEDESLGSFPAPAVSHDDTSVVPGVHCSYSVRALGEVPPEGLVRPVSATSPVNAGFRQMPAPTGVLASDGDRLADVAVTWDAVPGAVGYQVFRGTTSIATGVVSTHYNDDAVPQGTRASYTVRAVGAAVGAVSLASAADFGYRNRPGPTGVQATDTDLAKVRITWTPAAAGTPAVSGYEVRRLEDESAPIILTASLNASANSFDDTTATPGTIYVYEVRARYPLAGSAPVQVVTTLPGSDTGIRPVAFAAAGGAAAGVGGFFGSKSGESGLASRDPFRSRNGSDAVGDGDGNALDDDRVDPARPGVEGDIKIDAIPCAEVARALLLRVSDLEDRLAAIRDDGDLRRKSLLESLLASRWLLDPIDVGTDAGDAERSRKGSPRACLMAQGDIDLDGDVDGGDLIDFIDAWATGDEVRADLNRDGVIDEGDLRSLLLRLTAIEG